MVSWKTNWAQTRDHFIAWWNHQGPLVAAGDHFPMIGPREPVRDPGPEKSSHQYYTDPAYRAAREHFRVAHGSFPGDTLPMAGTMTGPGSLALFLGSEPGFSPETIWFKPCIDPADPESHPPLRFDPENRWWKITEQTLRECVRLGDGKYLTPCPDLIENIDILAALRDPQLLLMDLLERPEWVERKVAEINRVWFDAYSRIYDIIKLPDGSSAFDAFRLWGPGKVAKVQCDACAMFGPDIFGRLVLPALTEQCEWLDHSMYHFDGHQCMPNLDLLLSIDALDAIEWTPDPQVPPGGDPCWYPLYRRIMDAGKSVQAVGIRAGEVRPLLDAVGPRGLYMLVNARDEREFEEIVKTVDGYR